jgi:hypothetical protein
MGSGFPQDPVGQLMRRTADPDRHWTVNEVLALAIRARSGAPAAVNRATTTSTSSSSAPWSRKSPATRSRWRCAGTSSSRRTSIACGYSPRRSRRHRLLLQQAIQIRQLSTSTGRIFPHEDSRLRRSRGRHRRGRPHPGPMGAPALRRRSDRRLAGAADDHR